MNSILVVSSENPNNIQAKCTFSEPNDKEYLNPEYNWDSATFTIMSTDFANQHNNQEN